MQRDEGLKRPAAQGASLFAMLLLLVAGCGGPEAQHDPHDGRVDLLVTHSMSGAAEPCGCGGNRSGGGASRLSVVRAMREGASHRLQVIEGGNWLSGGQGTWDAAVLDAMVELFRLENCAAVCVGPNEIGHLPRLVERGLPLACLNLRAIAGLDIPR